MAENEVVFRDVNERVRSIAAAHGVDDHVYEFYCECANADCTYQVAATIAEYEAVRTHPERFIVSPGHVVPEVERVADQSDGWWVVEKIGESADFVARRDPRGA